MKILNRKQQKACIVNLAMIQHRLLEAMSLLKDVLTVSECKCFFETTLDSLHEIAKTIEPDIGLKFMVDTFDRSWEIIKDRRMQGKEKDDEQSDHDREPGE